MSQQPEGKPTVRFAAPTEDEVFRADVRAGLKRMERVEGLVEQVITDHIDVVTRLTVVEEWKTRTSTRVGANEAEVRVVSNTNLEQDAAIAAEIAKRVASEQVHAEKVASLEKEIADTKAINLALVEAKNEAKAFFKRPAVAYAIGSIWVAIVAFVLNHFGVHLTP